MENLVCSAILPAGTHISRRVLPKRGNQRSALQITRDLRRQPTQYSRRPEIAWVLQQARSSVARRWRPLITVVSPLTASGPMLPIQKQSTGSWAISIVCSDSSKTSMRPIYPSMLSNCLPGPLLSPSAVNTVRKKSPVMLKSNISQAGLPVTSCQALVTIR